MITSIDDPRLANVDTFYLDGNNMFFCRKEIRQLCLNRKTKEAELLLVELIQKKLAPRNLKLIYVIFDQATSVYT